MSEGPTRFPGPFDDVRDQVRSELDTYLATAATPERRTAITRCAPWTGDDLTTHLAMTFDRFTRMLVQSRTGDLTPPFRREELEFENQQAIDRFRGDPFEALATHATEFCDTAGDPTELMAHQFGPIPVGLQMHFGLFDLAAHHDDLLSSESGRYIPPEATTQPLVVVWSQLFNLEIGDGADPWSALLRHSGR